MTDTKPATAGAWATAKPFVNGGLSGMAATTIIQPIDMVKVRLQLGASGGPVSFFYLLFSPLAPLSLSRPRKKRKSNLFFLKIPGKTRQTAPLPPQFSVAAQCIKESGVSGLYRGLSAGLLRQATYTTARLGIFNSLSEALKERMPNGEPLPLYQKAGAGLAAGGLGALVGSPADLSLIRMQADSTLPAAQRRNYKGVGDALTRIVREEGAGGLFRGAGPTVVRAMALNMGMLASNDQAKEMLQAAGYGGQTAVMGGESWVWVWVSFIIFHSFRFSSRPPLFSVKTHSLFLSLSLVFFPNQNAGAMIAGFFAAASSLPFDYVKTQIQEMKAGPDGKMPYSGPIDCALKTVAKRGPLAFYTGFPTYCVRIAPHAVITLLFVANLPKWEKAIGL